MNAPSREEVVQHAGSDDLLFLDGYDDCLLGIVERFGMAPVAVYDKDKIIQSLMRSGSTYEEAVEYFEFNMIGAWVGDTTPAFVSMLGTP